MDGHAGPPAAVSGGDQQAQLERRVHLPVPLLHRLEVHRGVPAQASLPEAPGRFVLQAKLKTAGLLADFFFGGEAPAELRVGAPAGSDGPDGSRRKLFPRVVDAAPPGPLGVLISYMTGDVLHADLHVQVVAEGGAEQEIVEAIPSDVVQRVLDVELPDETGLDVELPSAEAQQPEPPAELQAEPPVPGVGNLGIGDAEDRDAELWPSGVRDVSGI